MFAICPRRHQPLYNDRHLVTMTTLIVTLPLSPADPSSEYDYVLSVDNLSLAGHGRTTAALLPKLSGEVVAIVPARALSWHRLSLPRGTLNKRRSNEAHDRTANQPPLPKSTRHHNIGNPQRLRAVLTGLLEERLLDEPEHLHFALAPDASIDEPVWVAACDRAWLHAALKALEAAQRPVSRIVPEFTPDADISHQQTLYITEGLLPAQINYPTDQGVTVLPLTPASVSLLNLSPHHELVAEPAVAGISERLFQRPVSLQSSAQRYLQAAQSPWNLAQFDLSNTGHTRTLKRLNRAWSTFLHAPQWRAARWSSVLILVIHLIGLNTWAWKERSIIDSKRTAIRNTLSDTFPETKVVVDAPLQMSRTVAQLQQAAGVASGQDLETLLGHLSALLPAEQSLSAIAFSAGQARLKGLSLSTEQAATLSAQMKTRGYSAQPEADSWLIRPSKPP